MLTFRPIIDLAAYEIPSHLNAYGAYEEDKLLGMCTFEMAGYEVHLLNLSLQQEDAAVAEGLVRSALHYAGNRGAYTALFQGSEWSKVCQNLQVRKTGRGFEGEIPEILMGSCHNL